MEDEKKERGGERKENDRNRGDSIKEERKKEKMSTERNREESRG